jgi:hypothetical protein
MENLWRRDLGDLRATAALMLVDAAVTVPVLAVEVASATPDRDDDARSWLSGLAEAGLTFIASAADSPPRAEGWRVLVLFADLEKLRIIIRSSDGCAFFAGSCTMTDGWDELVTSDKGCILLAGNLILGDIPRAEITPDRVARAVSSAAQTRSVVAAGLTPVTWISRMADEDYGDLAGFANLEGSSITGLIKQSQEGGAAADSQDSEIAVDKISRAFRPETDSMSREQIRERLVARLLEAGQMPPSRVVDYYTDNIALGEGTLGKTRRWSLRQRDAATTGWSALRSLEQIVRGRAVQHWHIMGIHRVEPSPGSPRHEIILNHDAGKWLAVGEDDVFDIWLGPVSNGEPLKVFRGDMTVGILGTDADVIYRPLVTESGHEDVIVVASAIRSRTAADSWRLRTFEPSQGIKSILGRLTR